MQMRNAASVLPEPVGAEIRVVRPARICGQPCSCGSVGVPKGPTNHSATSGCAHARADGISPTSIPAFYQLFANCSPAKSAHHRGTETQRKSLAGNPGERPFNTEITE